MPEMPDLKRKYGFDLTPEQMLYMDQMRPKTDNQIATDIIRESSPDLKPPPGNFLNRAATGAGQAADLVNKYAPKAYDKIPKKVTSLAPFGFLGLNQGFQNLLAQSSEDVSNAEVPTSMTFGKIEPGTNLYKISPEFGEGRTTVGKIAKAIKPSDLLGLNSAKNVYSDLSYGQAPEPMDVLDTVGLGAGMTQLGRAGLKGASSVARAGAPYVAEGLTDLVSKYGVDPRMNITPDAPSMSGAVPEGFKLGQENGKAVVFDASGKIFASGNDAQAAIFRANKRLENEAANAARTARREERAAAAPVVEETPLVKVEADDQAPLFYNPLSKAAANLGEETDPLKVLSDLKNFENMTDDQITFSGVADYLEAKAAKELPVTREEVQDFINENRIKLYEHIRDESGSGKYEPEDLEIASHRMQTEDPDDDYLRDIADNEEEYVRDNYYDEIYNDMRERYPDLDEEGIQENVDAEISDRAWELARDSYYENPQESGTNDAGYQIIGSRDSGYSVITPEGRNITPPRGYFDDLDDANRAIFEDALDNGLIGDPSTKTLFGENTQYAQYMMPGGRNYRELNIGLQPGSKDKTAGKIKFYNQYIDNLQEEANAIRQQHPIIRERPDDVTQRLEEIGNRIQVAEDLKRANKESSEAWYGTHFEDEPDLFAQLRLQDYQDVDGMSGTLIDEAQSDMHQKGRDKGYRATNKEINAKRVEQTTLLNNFRQASTNVPSLRVYDSYTQLINDMAEGEQTFFDRLEARIVRDNNTINLDNLTYPNKENGQLVKFPEGSDLDEAKRLIGEAQKLKEGSIELQRMEFGIPDAPFKKDWYHVAIRRAIKDAIDNGKDRVYLPTGEALADRYNYASAVDQIAYKVKSNGKYSVTLKDFDGNWNQTIGNQSFNNLDADELNGIFGKEVADKIRNKDVDQINIDLDDTTYLIENQSIDVGGKGFKQYYDENYPNFMKKEAKEFDAKTGYTKIPTPVTSNAHRSKLIRATARANRVSVDEMRQRIRNWSQGQQDNFFNSRQEPVFYLEINDAMRQAYGKGRPYARGGLVTDALDSVDDYFENAQKFKKGGKAESTKEKGADDAPQVPLLSTLVNTKQEFRAVKPSPIMSSIATGLGKASDFLKSRPMKETDDMSSAINTALELVDTFFVNDLSKTADRMSYGQRLTSGSGQTLQVLPETLGAVLTVAPPAAKLAAKTAKVAAKVAPDVAETAAQMAERYAMKPMYAVPEDDSKFLPLALPRTRRSPEKIDELAQRVSRQMTGEHVRNPVKLKETQNLAGRSLKESQRVQGIDYTLENTKNLPEPVVIEPKVGDVNVATVGDITVADKVLVDVNGYPINSTQQGGPFFGQGKLHLPDDESLWWASEPTSAKNFQNRVTEIADHYGVDKLTAQHLAMGQTANNFAMHFADANLKAIATYGVPEEGIAAINSIVRQGFSRLKDGERIYFAFPDFPGVENMDEAYKYFRANPEARKFFNERMKKQSVTQPNGLPNGLDIEWAITDPLLRNMEKNLTGRSVGEVYRGAGITDTADHGTYGAGIRGRFKGTSKYPTPMELSYSDAYDYTAARKRPQDVTGTMQKIAPHQVVDEQYLDEIGRYNDLIKKYTGKKKGGTVEDDSPPLPPSTGKELTEAEIADWQRKSKAYENRQYWKRRGANSPDENDTPGRLDGRNDSYPMRSKVPEQFNKYFMPEYRDEELPFKKAMRYYSKGGSAKITDDYSIAPEAKTGKWSQKDEKSFQKGVRGTKWYKQFADKYGEPPDLNSKDYNYRAAWKAGVRPQDYEHDAEMQHWASTTGKGESLKATNHPTAWMEDYMQVTGSDPHEPANMNPEQIKAMEKALMYRYGQKYQQGGGVQSRRPMRLSPSAGVDLNMLRPDGSQKSARGFLGPMEAVGGKTSTEISAGFEIGGKEMDIPLLVPGLTKKELDYLLKTDISDKTFMKNLPESIRYKAITHAEKRIKDGKSVFYVDGEEKIK